MNRRAHRRTPTPTRDGVEFWRERNPRHEAAHLVQMVRSGRLTVDQARALIGVNAGEAVVLRKLLEPYNARVALSFRRAVLMAFDALVETKMRTRRR